MQSGSIFDIILLVDTNKYKEITMKKYILTLAVFAILSPAFASEFNVENLKLDANIKSEIETTLTQKINTLAKENIKAKDIEQNSDNEIIKAIKKEMEFTLKQINRNTKLRKNIFTRGFVEEQQMQQQRYEDMLKWDVPTQIYEYIEMNFDLNKVQNPWAICIYHNETILELRFTFDSHYVVIYYDYNDEQNHIKHIID